METHWHIISEIITHANGEIAALAVAPSASPWFSGHFPENPILPGIAQIGIVFELLKQTSDHPLALDSVKRLRFKKAIGPDTSFHIHIRPVKAKAHHYSFQIIVQDEVVCRGVLTTYIIN